MRRTRPPAATIITLTGGGTLTYATTETYNANTGDDSSATPSGTPDQDNYSYTETGTQNGQAYTQTLSGTDLYTTTCDTNDLDGGYTSNTSGTANYTSIDSISGTTTGSNSFSTSGSGNYVSGQLSMTQTGQNHFQSLRQYNDTSNAASGTPGTVDSSPVGAGVFPGPGRGRPDRRRHACRGGRRHFRRPRRPALPALLRGRHADRRGRQFRPLSLRERPYSSRSA